MTEAAREYEALLRRLHELNPQGELESPELDAICDDMDGPWLRMTGEERSAMCRLSEELYELADARP